MLCHAKGEKFWEMLVVQALRWSVLVRIKVLWTDILLGCVVPN